MCGLGYCIGTLCSVKYIDRAKLSTEHVVFRTTGRNFDEAGINQGRWPKSLGIKFLISLISNTSCIAGPEY
jgi:hypothetical protein